MIWEIYIGLLSSECKSQQDHAWSPQCSYKRSMDSCKYQRIVKVGSKVSCGNVECTEMSQKRSMPYNFELYYLCLQLCIVFKKNKTLLYCTLQKCSPIKLKKRTGNTRHLFHLNFNRESPLNIYENLMKMPYGDNKI